MEANYHNESSNSDIGNSIFHDVIPATPGVYPKPRKYRKKYKRVTTEKENEENSEINTEVSKFEQSEVYRVDKSMIQFTPYDYDSLANLNILDSLKVEIPTVGSFYGPRDFNRPFVYIDNEEIFSFDKNQLYKIYKVHLLGFYVCEQNRHILLTNMQTRNKGIQLLFLCFDSLPVSETFISVFGYVDFINNDLDNEFCIVVKFFREESLNDIENLRCLSKSVRHFVPTICFLSQ